jgi:MerR family transcriptional regulator/heat shock protein HspR
MVRRVTKADSTPRAKTRAGAFSGERRSRSGAAYAIGVVAERYGIHPQTLRLYERENLLVPARSEGNTRLYSEEDLKTLEFILNLTRNLGVNLAGVEVVLNMRGRMLEIQHEVEELLQRVQREFAARRMEPPLTQALVRLKDLYREDYALEHRDHTLFPSSHGQGEEKKDERG